VGPKTAQGSPARFADAAVVVGQDVPALCVQIVGESRIVPAAHRGRGIDDGHRERSAARSRMAPLAAPQGVAVGCGDDDGFRHDVFQWWVSRIAPMASPILRTAHSVRGVKTEAWLRRMQFRYFPAAEKMLPCAMTMPFSRSMGSSACVSNDSGNSIHRVKPPLGWLIRVPSGK